MPTLARPTVAVLAAWLAAGCAAVVSDAPAPGPGPAARVVSPERAAEVQALEAESAARLAAEGELLFLADKKKKDPHEYCGLAWGLIEQGELRRGIREASRALFLGQRAKDPYVVAIAARDLAYAYSLGGLLPRAEQFATEALEQVRRVSDPKANRRLVLGPAHKILGDVRLRQGRPQEAIAAYQQALAEGEEPWKPYVTASLANAHLARGELARARQLFEEAQAGAGPGVRQMIARGFGQVALAERRLPEAERLFAEAAARAAGGDGSYHRVWALDGLGRARRAQGNRAGALEAYVAAMDAAEEVRARFRSEEFKTAFFGDLQRVFDEAVDLLMASARFEQALETSERSRARALLDQVRGRVRTTAAGEAFADPLGRPLGADRLRAAVPAGVAVVEYHVGRDRTYVWVLRPGTITGLTIDLPRERLAQAVTALRDAVRTRAPEAPARARELHDMIVPPGLRPGEALVVVAHDVLHYVPFQALRGPEGWLIERHPVSYAPSATVAAALLARPARSREAGVALGNPDLGSARLALPAAEREVATLGQLFARVETFVKREATKERLLTRAPESGLVHVAAHASVDEIDPLYSVIHLARTEQDPGGLEAHEIYRLDLSRPGLVTLSACETGLGRISRGDEIWGFSRSFLSAGVPALLVSLWPVEDESTARLMGRFYRELRGGAHGNQALRAAQIEVLGEARTTHPFFWAPFALVGDWR
jgi:CHAT domain-containing protein